jgi:hypothetical protein
MAQRMAAWLPSSSDQERRRAASSAPYSPAAADEATEYTPCCRPAPPQPATVSPATSSGAAVCCETHPTAVGESETESCGRSSGTNEQPTESRLSPRERPVQGLGFSLVAAPNHLATSLRRPQRTREDARTIAIPTDMKPPVTTISCQGCPL